MQNITDAEFNRELSIAEREKRFDEIKIKQNKKQLIADLKGGLGEQMKQNPSLVEIIVPPKETFKDKLIKFFKRF